MSPRPASLLFALACALGAPSALAAERDLMGEWKAYAQARLTPAFAWSDLPKSNAPQLHVAASHRLPTRSEVATFALSERLGLRIAAVDGASVAPAASFATIQARSSGFARSAYASTLQADLPGDTRVGLSAVMTQQRFLTPGMGESLWDTRGRMLGAAFDPSGEVVSGFGLRADYQVPFGRESRWTVSLQSRVDMEAFKAYRGVYSEPGDFDIPAQAGVRYARDLGRATLSLGVERVFYSDISAVTSYGLPNRLLSLLGDGASPEFAWRDLTVYSAGAAYAVGERGSLSLRYSTRLQPSPTSALLQRAMQRDFSNRNFALGYRHELGRFGQLQFTASHSGASYFVGSVPLRQRDFNRGAVNEFELLWALPF